MTARERAKALLREQNLAHVIYGYRANRKTVETDWEADMKKFRDDDSFVAHIDQMQSSIPGLEMILAVHA